MQDQQPTSDLLGSSPVTPIVDPPRIYVACLAAYNSGILHGCWIDAEDVETVWEAVREMLAASPIEEAEEWAIHDYEGFKGVEISEYAGFDDVCQLAEFIGAHGSLGGLLVQHFGGCLDEALAALEDYAGEYKSFEYFAMELIEQSGIEIADNLAMYIDYEAMGRDMALSGDVFTIETGFEQVHVFWSR